MAPLPPIATPKNNETLYAILASALIAVVLATLLTGNPFRALVMGYIDYSHTPAGGKPAASATHAPENK